MKTTKRVIAIVLAALMLAMAIPFAASAATNYSFTLKCAKPGYEFTVYPLATIDDTTGAYTAVNTVTDNAVKAEINASKADTQALMEACQTSTGIGSGLADKFTSSDTTSTKEYTQPAGIYFVKVTGVPVTNTDVLGGAIIVLDKNVTEEVDLAAKVLEGDEPRVDKNFLVNGSTTKATQTFGTGDTITYVLTADVPGSFTNQLTQYIITDTMGTGLEKTVHDVTSVQLDNGTTKTPLTYDVTTSAAEIGATATFGVKLRATELEKESFYGAGNKVVVTYTTRLAADAPIATNIPNTDGLVYTNAGGSNTVPGPTVNAKTYKIVAKKIDAQTNQPVAGAEFTLTYPDGTTKKVATSGTDGIADFGVLLKAGTYTVQETKEPNGYTINTKVETVTVGDDTTGDVTVTISDTKTKTPKTGGAGTMMFTIIGGSLVLLAGALFVVVMKKRSSK